MKAYDQVGWDFLEVLLICFGFHPHWFQIIIQCVSTVSYHLVLNVMQYVSYRPSRGICQGDPLFPYIFILMAETLSAMLHRRALQGILRGIKLARQAPFIFHLFFVDDSQFFLQAFFQDCDQLKERFSFFDVMLQNRESIFKSQFFFLQRKYPNLHVGALFVHSFVL